MKECLASLTLLNFMRWFVMANQNSRSTMEAGSITEMVPQATEVQEAIKVARLESKESQVQTKDLIRRSNLFKILQLEKEKQVWYLHTTRPSSRKKRAIIKRQRSKDTLTK